MIKALSAALKPVLSKLIFTSNNLGLSSLVILVLYCCALVYLINRSNKGLKIPKIRRIAGLSAIDEAVGRSTEMGRPVLYSPGIGGFVTETFASFGVLGYVAKLAAQYNTRLIVANRNPNVHPVTEEIVKQSYAEIGKPDAYRPDDVRFITSDQFGYAAGVVGIMNREGVAANIMVGEFLAESLIFAEAGYQAGAIQVAGTANTAQIPFFISACDYCLIGEEIYAAGGYLSKDSIRLATLVAQDWGKQVFAVMIIVGAILATFNITWLTDLLKLY